MEAHPDVVISQTLFLSLKPYFVWSLKNCNVCCCLAHVEISLFLDSLNSIKRSNILHDRLYKYSCAICGEDDEHGKHTACTSKDLTYPGITLFWQTCVSPKAIGNTWYNQECLLGNCGMCGVSRLLPLCPGEEFREAIAKCRCTNEWTHWMMRRKEFVSTIRKFHLQNSLGT